MVFDFIFSAVNSSGGQILAKLHIITKVLMDEADKLFDKEIEMKIWNSIISKIGLKPLKNTVENINQLGGD